MGASLLTLQKDPAILHCIVPEIWPGKTQI